VLRNIISKTQHTGGAFLLQSSYFFYYRNSFLGFQAKKPLPEQRLQDALFIDQARPICASTLSS
jgi:hypothetical protein